MIWRSLGLILLLTAPPGAQGLRCQNGLVSGGAHKVEVLAAYPIRITGVRGWATVESLPFGLFSEESAYDFGPQLFLQLLRFRNNLLVVIETLSKPR